METAPNRRAWLEGYGIAIMVLIGASLLIALLLDWLLFKRLGGFKGADLQQASVPASVVAFFLRKISSQKARKVGTRAL